MDCALDCALDCAWVSRWIDARRQKNQIRSLKVVPLRQGKNPAHTGVPKTKSSRDAVDTHTWRRNKKDNDEKNRELIKCQETGKVRVRGTLKIQPNRQLPKVAVTHAGPRGRL